MINLFTPPPSWLPSLVQPEDYFVCKVILLAILAWIIRLYWIKGGDRYGSSL